MHQQTDLEFFFVFFLTVYQINQILTGREGACDITTNLEANPYPTGSIHNYDGKKNIALPLKEQTLSYAWKIAQCKCNFSSFHFHTQHPSQCTHGHCGQVYCWDIPILRHKEAMMPLTNT